MTDQEGFKIFDVARMMKGDVPPEFMLEVVLRIFVVFLIIMISMRFLGRRMSVTLNRNDLAALVSIAAAIGIPIQEPTRGLVPAVIITIVIVLMIKGLNQILTYRRKIEKISQGTFSILVKDGIIQNKDLVKNGLSRQQLFAQLRTERIDSLGQVQRLYIESNGNYVLKRNPGMKAGLSTIPEWDKDFFPQERIDENDNVCCNCGFLNEERKNEVCPECFEKDWTEAIL